MSWLSTSPWMLCLWTSSVSLISWSWSMPVSSMRCGHCDTAGGSGAQRGRRRLGPVVAPARDRALPAPGQAGHADVAPVQDEPVVRVLPVGGRHALHQLLLHFQRGLARGEPGAVADAEDMRVHGHGLFAEGDV